MKPIVPVYITENGVVRVKVKDVIKTDTVRKQLAGIRRLRLAGQEAKHG